MKCPKCAGDAGSGRFCRSCGAPLTAAVEAPAAADICPSCGAEVRPGAKFCASCAMPLGRAPVAPPAPEVVICVHCGAEAKADTKFCKSCGKPISSGAPGLAPPVAPDMMPTAVMSSPPGPPAPAPPPPAPRLEAARPARPPAPPPAAVPRMEPPAAPRLVPRSEAAPPPAPQAPRASGSYRLLVVACIILFGVVAGGLVYRFVLKKPVADNGGAPANSAPASAQPASPTTPEPSPEATNPESQPASTDGGQPAAADSSAPEAPPTPNSDGKGSAGVAPARVPKRPAAKPAGPGYTQAHANALQAVAASQYLNPADGSALFWARKAKALGDPEAAQIEQQIYSKLLSDVTAARQSHSYEQAQAQLYQLASSFPEHTELRSMQDEIHQEQQRYTQQMEEQKRQAELAAQTKKFAVQHRHGTGESFCTGLITITPDGVGHYDCTTADGKGRCEHVTFGADSLKEAKVRGDGSLHVATRQQGNFDFTGADFAMRDAAAALGRLVKR